MATYIDPGGLFSFAYPRSWGQATQQGEAIRLAGRDEFIGVRIVDGSPTPLDYARSDAGGLAAASPGFQGQAPTAYTAAGRAEAVVAYTWRAGPSPVTGKAVPSAAKRYYIAGPGGNLAVFTYSGPTQTYDPAGADDFANAFAWGEQRIGYEEDTVIIEQATRPPAPDPDRRADPSIDPPAPALELRDLL